MKKKIQLSSRLRKKVNNCPNLYIHIYILGGKEKVENWGLKKVNPSTVW